ncbi:tudor domain-containing protein 6 [Hippocampus comes]|uniref:Tudor domain containing 6 n=1 Tax=Hippocampus comes TaxID=109280 RepID=A0A3Q2Z488_HIPCM|nr:PREDICTED: tudor domain-containing protein 6 [Hippocampus comes]
MCSIPGLPTPGSEITVEIRKVNPNSKCGLMELWVNIDVSRKHAYEQMKKQIQLPERKFCGSEGKTGDLCLVCSSSMWHRARIVSIQSDTCEVFLIDQGQPCVSTWDALAWGQSDSFFLPPEIEFCILANVISLKENWSKDAYKFLSSLPEKTLKGVVQHVLMPSRTVLLDIPFVSKRMCTLGAMRKLPADEFKGVILECLTPPKDDAPITLCKVTKDQCANVHLDDRYVQPELLCGIYETVNVTEVTDPQNIFCNLQIYSKALETLSEEIQQFYKESSDSRGQRPQTCGEPCAARGNNGTWYRSLLKQSIGTDDELVEVTHVDVGKTEFLPVGCIRHVGREFLKMPVVTYHFSLHGLDDNGSGWTAKQNEYLKSVLLNKTFVAKLENHFQETYSVTLYAGNVASCMNKSLKEKVEGVPLTRAEGQQPEFQIEALSQEQEPDLQNLVTLNIKTSLKEALSSTDYRPDTDDVDTLPSVRGDVKIIDDQHISQICHHEHVLSVGSTLDVTVSCVEGPQKFWCQSTKNGETLRRLMGDLQNHYASVQPLPMKSTCVARNPEDSLWYRARIISSHHSPEVEVQFLDYGGTRSVPLGDVCPIDPVFLQLEPQAFRCCLVNRKTNSSWIDSTSDEFQRFLAAGGSQQTGFKCTVKHVTCDEEGQPVVVVDIETASQSACSLSSLVPTDTYKYSTFDMESGTKEKAWITSSETVHRFFCQLNRNSHLFDKVKADVQQIVGKSQGSADLVSSDGLCLVRYDDNEWHRGKVVQTTPDLKVLFVDYGDTLTVNASDVQPLPAGASMAKSVPVLAVHLGLFGVPADVPQEVNRWFANHATGATVTVSVVAKGDGGKLLVELFEGLLNINVIVREKVAHAKRVRTSQDRRANQEVASERVNPTHEGSLPEELACISKLQEHNNDHNGKGTYASDEQPLETSPYMTAEPRRDCEETVLDEESTRSNATAEVSTETPKDIHPDDAVVPPPEKSSAYHPPIIRHHTSQEMYASCIVGPSYFWCQFARTENLDSVSRLTQSVGETLKDTEVPKYLDPGSPCLALFSADSQWHRAQVLRRTDGVVCVLFVDYGNESEVDVQDVRYLPSSLIEHAPQAFLCSLDGFDESKGSWDDQVYDDFYNLLVDKLLSVTVLSAQEHSEIGIQEHSVKIQCAGRDLNEAMQRYWKPISTETEVEKIPTAGPPQPSYPSTQSNTSHLEEDAKAFSYKRPNIPLNKMEVYASCIVEPHFFWCQFANTEVLGNLVRLAQEAGQAATNPSSASTFGPGGPCLALFSADNQWYRALILSREEDQVHVVFIDYGNESDVDVKDVRRLPPILQEWTPQAFLCSLSGFDQSKGTWEDEVYDHFYDLLVDKPLRVVVSRIAEHSDMMLPQHVVEIESEGVSVNAAMQKYWKPTTQ